MKGFKGFGLAFAVAAISVFAALAPARADGDDVAMKYVSGLADTFIKNNLSTNVSEKKKVANFRSVFTQNCDMDFISKFVLGKAARKATGAEKSSFTKAFSENVVLTWAARFREYSGQTVKVTGSKPAQNGQIYVESKVVSPNPQQAPIDLLWRLKKSGASYKIVDLIVEGVSMTMSYRNEYASLLQASNGDISQLVKSLDEKNKILANDLGV